MQVVADPPHAESVDGCDTGNACGGLFRGRDQLRVDGVHESGSDLLGGAVGDHGDGQGDGEANQWVSQGEAESDTGSTGNHGEGGEAIGPGVGAVGDECRRADASSDPSPPLRHQLVPQEADHACRGHGPQVVDLPRVGQSTEGFPARQHSRGDDQDHDNHTGEILRATQAVGEASSGCPPAEKQRNADGQDRQRVGEVVDGVAEQGNRAGHGDHHSLQNASGQQCDEGPHERAHAEATCLEGRIEPVARVVAVGRDEVAQASEHALTTIVMGAMRMRVLVWVGMGHSSPPCGAGVSFAIRSSVQ